MTIFLVGILILFIALLSPIHELGDNYLFSAHMVQHLLLISVVCPLLLLGTPAWLLRPMLRHPRVMGAARTLTRPVVAFVLFNLVFAFWHLPVLYDLALRQQGIHILEHIMFLGAGLIMWWPILSPLPELPRSPYVVQMLYLFLQPTVPSILGAIITFSDGTLYAWYAEAPRIWGISAPRRPADWRPHHVDSRRLGLPAHADGDIPHLGKQGGSPGAAQQHRVETGWQLQLC